MAAYGTEMPQAYRPRLADERLQRQLFAFSAVELRDGRWAALEIKLGEAKVPDGIRNIERLREKVASNLAARSPKPEFCAVVAATSPFCRYDATHDVYVFPISALRS